MWRDSYIYELPSARLLIRQNEQDVWHAIIEVREPPIPAWRVMFVTSAQTTATQALEALLRELQPSDPKVIRMIQGPIHDLITKASMEWPVEYRLAQLWAAREGIPHP